MLIPGTDRYRYWFWPIPDLYRTEIPDVIEGGMREIGQPDHFDILAWWQANASRYKILSYMARDILAMSVSSVASESAFSTGKRVLTPWRASMSTRTVEALLCTQSFLQKPIALDLLCDYIPDDAVEDEAGKKPVPEWNRTGLTGTGTSPGPGTGTGPQIEEPVNSVYSYNGEGVLPTSDL
ncbi:hypothetical protein C5167_032667 [Papaver somniferum]|uniref:HAT C-terminal dimerisation domain-containing protein n=1 Tax=Papaver somniferum TaxID=3469 RepID=A0A4Y7K834_PAPSO|nr:hypothetical protein C5167_032667 [Papaver somniferum]